MSGGDQMTLLGAVQVLGFLVTLVAIATGVMWLLERCGLLDDPDDLYFEDTPGTRNDRQRLLDEGRVQ